MKTAIVTTICTALLTASMATTASAQSLKIPSGSDFSRPIRKTTRPIRTDWNKLVQLSRSTSVEHSRPSDDLKRFYRGHRPRQGESREDTLRRAAIVGNATVRGGVEAMTWGIAGMKATGNLLGGRNIDAKAPASNTSAPSISFPRKLRISW